MARRRKSRGSHSLSFEEALTRFRIDTVEKMERVVKISVATVAEMANANAPRRTGRLRRSRRVQVGGDPAIRDMGKALESFELGDRIVISWRAFYAKIQERGGRSRRGRKIGGKRFVERAAKKWPAIVNHVAERISKE